MDQNKRFEVLSVGEMRKKYYQPNESPPTLHLDPQKVPESLRILIPLAEKWGISDDMLRVDFVARASPDEVKELQRIVAQYEDRFDQWLAGSESKGPKFSDEYCAFSNLRMAADGC